MLSATMARRKTSGKDSSQRERRGRKAPAEGVLDRLAADEATAVLRLLLEEHPELRSEAEQLATDLVSSSSVEDVADNIFARITGVDLDALNQQAGAHSWGYVEPSEAAWELLEEEVEDLVSDMKRKADLRLASAAEAVCRGIVEGLYRARHTKSDGALGWAPDFPLEKAPSVIEVMIESIDPKDKSAAQTRLLEALAVTVPEWMNSLRRVLGGRGEDKG